MGNLNDPDAAARYGTLQLAVRKADQELVRGQDDCAAWTMRHAFDSLIRECNRDPTGSNINVNLLTTTRGRAAGLNSSTNLLGDSSSTGELPIFCSRGLNIDIGQKSSYTLF